MSFPLPGSRLFWKLALALLLSSVLAVAGAYLISTLTGLGPPRPPPNRSFESFPIRRLISGLCAIVIIGFFLAWYLSRPLRHLRWALRQVAQGHLDTRVQPLMRGQRDEIADLARDFDAMAEQLQNAVESQRTLLHDVSHELRSPLARLQAAIGLIRQDPSLLESMLSRIELESSRLDELIEELLTFHRLDAAAPATPPEWVDLIELLQAVAEDARFEASLKGCWLNIEASGEFLAEAHGELIYRAFENVIRNAVKYSPSGSSIDVRADESAQGLAVDVADRGPGVPADMLEEIFKPFVRSPHDASQRGSGLGLAIAQRAMHMHEARVSAALREGGGLLVRMEFPKSLTQRLHPS